MWMRNAKMNWVGITFHRYHPLAWIIYRISLPCVSTPADIFLVFRTLLNCLKCIIYEDCYDIFIIRQIEPAG